MKKRDQRREAKIAISGIKRTDTKEVRRSTMATQRRARWSMRSYTRRTTEISTRGGTREAMKGQSQVMIRNSRREDPIQDFMQGETSTVASIPVLGKQQ